MNEFAMCYQRLGPPEDLTLWHPPPPRGVQMSDLPPTLSSETLSTANSISRQDAPPCAISHRASGPQSLDSMCNLRRLRGGQV